MDARRAHPLFSATLSARMGIEASREGEAAPLDQGRPHGLLDRCFLEFRMQACPRVSSANLSTRVEGLTICGGVISPPLAVIPSTCHHTPPFALIPTGANTRKPDAKIRTKRTTHRPQQGEYPTRRAFAKRVPHKTSTPLGEQPDNRNPPGWRTSRAETSNTREPYSAPLTKRSITRETSQANL